MATKYYQKKTTTKNNKEMLQRKTNENYQNFPEEKKSKKM